MKNSGPSKPVVVFGTGNLARLVYALAADTWDVSIAAFTVEKEYRVADSLFGIPVVPFETCENSFAAADHAMLIATGPHRINRDRRRFLEAARKKKYALTSFIHPSAFVAHDVPMGANCILLAGVIIEPFCRIGTNCVFWSGATVAHDSVVADDCFLAPRATVSGCCTIEQGCFLGANSTIRDHIIVARETIVGAGVVIKRDTEIGEVYSQPRNPAYRTDSDKTHI